MHTVASVLRVRPAGQRHRGQQLVADVRRGDAGDLGMVVGGRHLDDVGADDLQAPQPAQGVEQLAARQPAGLRGAGAGCVRGVKMRSSSVNRLRNLIAMAIELLLRISL